MKKIVSQHQRNERARRKVMGVALIQRPLKYIRSRTNMIEKDVNGNPIVVQSAQSRRATRAAKFGWGETVQRIAKATS